MAEYLYCPRLTGVLMRNLFLLFFLLAGLPLAALAQVPFPTLAQPVMTFSFEDKDWGIAPTARPKRPPYHAPTPTSLPGARVIKTLELKELLLANKSVLVIDVLDSRERRSVPGSFWMSGAGDGEFYATEKARFAVALDKLTGADKARPLVFL